MELVDTDYEGMGGDYYINISWWSGIGGNNPGGIYRLIIGEPVGDTFEPSFNCDGFDDMMLGQGDALYGGGAVGGGGGGGGRGDGGGGVDGDGVHLL